MRHSKNKKPKHLDRVNLSYRGVILKGYYFVKKGIEGIESDMFLETETGGNFVYLWSIDWWELTKNNI